jgi:hypothetical protein
MDLLVDEKAPMQMSNIILKVQHQNVLEGQFSKDDDYADWIQCGSTDEDVQMQYRFGKNFEPKVHLYLIQMTNE